MDLRSYLDEHKITAPEFADAIGVSATTVYRYIEGARLPHREVMARIAEQTQGHVQPNDFFASGAPQKNADAA